MNIQIIFYRPPTEKIIKKQEIRENADLWCIYMVLCKFVILIQLLFRSQFTMGCFSRSTVSASKSSNKLSVTESLTSVSSCA